MYKTFRKTVEKIIEIYSGESVENFLSKDGRLKVKSSSLLDFSIEKCGDLLFIGYYSEENGDLVSDPIFVFTIKDNIWFPIRLEQWLGDTEIGTFEDGQYKYYPNINKYVKSFSVDCSKEWENYYISNKNNKGFILR